MNIYLPIAEMSVNIFLLLGLGGIVGFLSGMFGVGGGFLMTPLLIFTGIPPTVAVASEANQIVASSISGTIAHWLKKSVDFKMGLVLLTGGIVGSILGVFLFKYFINIGQVDLIINIAYVSLLSVIGSLMLFEGGREIHKKRTKTSKKRKLHIHYWIHGLPFKTRFQSSKLYISVIPPIILGFIVGILSAIMGIGGGFIIVPAMIYILGMPTSMVIGTSLFQIIFVTSVVTFMHATTNQTVDVVLALLLLLGSVVGAQFGARVSHKFKAEELRGLLGLVVLGVGIGLAYELFVTPQELFTIFEIN